jgi:hypothetical protein
MKTNNLFRTRAAADWVREAKLKPTPHSLFGNFWLEDELCVMFAERAVGKSILAVQIAESIARGKPIEPFQMSAPAQRVLYFDLELSAKQFEMRYAMDPDARDEFLTWRYEFSPEFQRSEIDPCITVPKEFNRFEDFVLAGIEAEVRRTDAKIIIIDSIDRFNGEIMRTRDIAYVMNRLKKLKAGLGLSILVLARLPGRNPRQPLAVDRLMATRTLCSFADNAFAIGTCRWDEQYRYLKHIRSQSTELIYDASHVPTFKIHKKNGNFLSFEFDGFRPESVHLDAYMNKYRLESSDRAKQLAAEGLTQREIAARLDISLGAVNRSLQMWSPFDGGCNCSPTKSAKTVEQVGNAGSPSASDLSTSDEIEAARGARALITHNYMLGLGLTGLPEFVAGGDERSVERANVSEPGAANSSAHAVSSLFDDLSTTEHMEKTGEDPISVGSFPILERLKRTHDSYGRQIFLEKKHDDGRHHVWYMFEGSGRLRRYEESRSGLLREFVASEDEILESLKNHRPTVEPVL